MRFEEALAELNSRQPERMIPDLKRITALDRLLGDPQLTYPTIHITGTNGKTTTARLITALACAHGLTTGTYTSPHLDSLCERMSVCGRPITEEEFAQEYERLLPYLSEVDAAGEKVTYFEVLTALASLWFSDKPVALGVFEVGMGGAWDATNLVAGDVAVVCPVGLDHPELGPGIADKAKEKADIIKEGKVAVVREQPPEALEVIRARCDAVGATMLLENEDFGVERRSQAVGGQLITIRSRRATYEDLMLTLYGEHSAGHAAAAIVALEAFLGRELDEDAVRASLGSAISPGRLEVHSRRPLVVLDGAHNPDGADALAEALRESFTWDAMRLVMAVSGDKDLNGILEPLARLATHAYVGSYSGERAAPPESLAVILREMNIDTSVFGSVEEALRAARKDAGESDLILVTGSLYTVADARRALSDA
ncbi:MAG: folylpolyglutamate synthase/dihydrofolate synthase family protein [Actinomycetota bacterium]